MNEVKTGLIAKNLLPVILALMLGASLATNVFLTLGGETCRGEPALLFSSFPIWLFSQGQRRGLGFLTVEEGRLAPFGCCGWLKV